MRDRNMLRAAALAALVLQGGPAIANPPQSVIVEAPSFENGMRAAREGDLFRAAGIFDTLLRQAPHSPAAYLGLAEVQRLGGHPEEADNWLLRGIAANPGSSELLRARARLAALRQHYDAAADLLAKAIALDPDDGQSRTELARLYAGPLGYARQTPERTLPGAALPSPPRGARHPSAALYYQLGIDAAGHGNITAAQQFLEEALRLQPWMEAAQTALWKLPEKPPAPRRAEEKNPRPREKDS